MTLLHKRCAPALWSRSWILSNSSASFLCCGSQTWMVQMDHHMDRAGGGSIISFTLMDPLSVCGMQFWGCKPILLACIKLFIHQNPQAFCTGLLSMDSSLSLCMYLRLLWSKCRPCTWPCWISLDSCGRRSSFELVKVPLDGIPSYFYINHSTQLGVIVTFDPTVCVADEDVEVCWSQDGRLDLMTALHHGFSTSGSSVESLTTNLLPFLILDRMKPHEKFCK